MRLIPFGGCVRPIWIGAAKGFFRVNFGQTAPMLPAKTSRPPQKGWMPAKTLLNRWKNRDGRLVGWSPVIKISTY
jgi:hypothetical protein